MVKILKGHENIDYMGIIVGTVVKANPCKISIYGGKAFFSGENLYICKNATEYVEEVTVNIGGYTYTGTAKHEGLKDKDKVACIATEDNQKLFVIDKVE